MLSVSRKVRLTAPVETVWARIGDFFTPDEWHPAVATCARESQVNLDRILTLEDGSTIRERLMAESPQDRHYAYIMVDEGPLPVSDYFCQLSASPGENESCHVNWDSTFNPAVGVEARDAEAVIEGVYDSGFASLIESYGGDILANDRSRLDDVKVCIFDAYGTLFNVHSAVARLKDVLGALTPQVSEIWRTKQLEYTWLRSLQLRHANFEQVTREALDYTLDVVGIRNEKLANDLMESYRQLSPYREARTTLNQIRLGGLPTAILSNGSLQMLASAVEGAKIDALLDDVLSVEAAGVFKPDPATYSLAVQRFNVEPREVVFVSSNGWDVAGAAAFGFQAVWVNRLGLPPERLPCGPDAEIRWLAELPSLVF